MYGSGHCFLWCRCCVPAVEGPTGVVINADTYSGSNGSRVVLLSCKAQAPLYPGANFTWSGIVCHNETHTDSTSTCTIMFGAQDDGKSVTCMAINSINSGISTSTTGMLRINGESCHTICHTQSFVIFYCFIWLINITFKHLLNRLLLLLCSVSRAQWSWARILSCSLPSWDLPPAILSILYLSRCQTQFWSTGA